MVLNYILVGCPRKLNSLWTVLLLPLCDQIACYVPTEKPMSITPVNSQCVLAKRRLHQDLMHSGWRGTAVPNVGLQAFSLFPLSSSPIDQRPVHWLRYFKALSTVFSVIFFRQNSHLHIATDDSREHQTCVKIATTKLETQVFVKYTWMQYLVQFYRSNRVPFGI